MRGERKVEKDDKGEGEEEEDNGEGEQVWAHIGLEPYVVVKGHQDRSKEVGESLKGLVIVTCDRYKQLEVDGEKGGRKPR